jgi:hypothetical protein
MRLFFTLFDPSSFLLVFVRLQKLILKTPIFGYGKGLHSVLLRKFQEGPIGKLVGWWVIEFLTVFFYRKNNFIIN